MFYVITKSWGAAFAAVLSKNRNIMNETTIADFIFAFAVSWLKLNKKIKTNE